MNNYEIMIIVDPKEDLKNIEKMSKEIFKDGLIKFEKMSRTNLAYPINNSTTAHYVLLNLKTSDKEIKEYTNKTNISKTI
jgi:small subunit ribosomal protein S6